MKHLRAVALIRSRDIYDDFSRTYGGTVGIISGKEKKARLLAVTTSSSLGRSSVYNRLKLGGIPYFTSIGYTGGWGHFHIPDDLFCGNGELRDQRERPLLGPEVREVSPDRYRQTRLH